MSRMPVIAFRPTAEQYQEFKALQTDGRSMSDIVKELVDKGLGSPLPVAPVAKNSHRKPSETLYAHTESNPSPVTVIKPSPAAKFVPSGTNYNSKPEKKRRGWGWLWWLLIAAVVLGAIYFVSQIQIYYWGG